MTKKLQPVAKKTVLTFESIAVGAPGTRYRCHLCGRTGVFFNDMSKLFHAALRHMETCRERELLRESDVQRMLESDEDLDREEQADRDRLVTVKVMMNRSDLNDARLHFAKEKSGRPLVAIHELVEGEIR